MRRRHFLGGALASLTLTLGGGSRALAQRCAGVRTEPNIEGPFYRPGAPDRVALVERPSLRLSGIVTDPGCRPMQDAVLELWQADANGDYDLHGDRLRGIVRTDANGRWSLATIFPGRYLNGATYRPAHIHVKVHATGRPPLTTQLYFPRDPHNDDDPWFRRSLVVSMMPPGCGQGPSHGRFDFVV